MKSATHVVLFALLSATIIICMNTIQGNVAEGHYIYWLGLAAAFVGLGAQALQLLHEIKDDLYEEEQRVINEMNNWS